MDNLKPSTREKRIYTCQLGNGTKVHACETVTFHSGDGTTKTFFHTICGAVTWGMAYRIDDWKDWYPTLTELPAGTEVTCKSCLKLQAQGE